MYHAQMTGPFHEYAATLAKAIAATEVTDASGRAIAVDGALSQAHATLRGIAGTHNKVMFIGNGGSAGIAGHLAIDFAKNGGVRSVTFNDASSLTCLGNDLGYDQVFSKQVEMQGLPGDILIAISSSGASKNILNAATAAKKLNCKIITLSGFTAENPLRRLGDLNFFVPSGVYGFVETGHQAILHAILDTAMGWTAATAHVQPSATVS
jgi:D-sedoheptulose 7-phosphate isomerase